MQTTNTEWIALARRSRVRETRSYFRRLAAFGLVGLVAAIAVAQPARSEVAKPPRGLVEAIGPEWTIEVELAYRNSALERRIANLESSLDEVERDASRLGYELGEERLDRVELREALGAMRRQRDWFIEAYEAYKADYKLLYEERAAWIARAGNLAEQLAECQR